MSPFGPSPSSPPINPSKPPVVIKEDLSPHRHPRPLLNRRRRPLPLRFRRSPSSTSPHPRHRPRRSPSAQTRRRQAAAELLDHGVDSGVNLLVTGSSPDRVLLPSMLVELSLVLTNQRHCFLHDQ